jgi:hypothetical protein
MLQQMVLLFTVGFAILGIVAFFATKEVGVVILVAVMYGGIMAVALWWRRVLIRKR